MGRCQHHRRCLSINVGGQPVRAVGDQRSPGARPENRYAGSGWTDRCRCCARITSRGCSSSSRRAKVSLGSVFTTGPGTPGEPWPLRPVYVSASRCVEGGSTSRMGSQRTRLCRSQKLKPIPPECEKIARRFATAPTARSNQTRTPRPMTWGFFLCRREDLNLHALSGTRPST